MSTPEAASDSLASYGSVAKARDPISGATIVRAAQVNSVARWSMSGGKSGTL